MFHLWISCLTREAGEAIFTYATSKSENNSYNSRPSKTFNSLKSNFFSYVRYIWGDEKMKRKVLAVLPARMGSTRFSGKVLYEFRGKPLLFYVWNRVRKARQIDDLVIATDSTKISKAAKSFGAQVFKTSKRHKTGTDRVAEVAKIIGGDIILNIQADNIGLSPSLLDRVIMQLNKMPTTGCATLVRTIRSDNELFDPNLVKVIADSQMNALWFSRFPLPYLQQVNSGKRFCQYRFLAHIGVYFYRRRTLDWFGSLAQSPLEKAESLEQLRILENGGKIRLFRTKARSISVDRPEDLKKITRLI